MSTSSSSSSPDSHNWLGHGLCTDSPSDRDQYPGFLTVSPEVFRPTDSASMTPLRLPSPSQINTDTVINSDTYPLITKSFPSVSSQILGPVKMTRHMAAFFTDMETAVGEITDVQDQSPKESTFISFDDDGPKQVGRGMRSYRASITLAPSTTHENDATEKIEACLLVASVPTRPLIVRIVSKRNDIPEDVWRRLKFAPDDTHDTEISIRPKDGFGVATFTYHYVEDRNSVFETV